MYIYIFHLQILHVRLRERGKGRRLCIGLMLTPQKSHREGEQRTQVPWPEPAPSWGCAGKWLQFLHFCSPGKCGDSTRSCQWATSPCCDACKRIRNQLSIPPVRQADRNSLRPEACSGTCDVASLKALLAMVSGKCQPTVGCLARGQ